MSYQQMAPPAPPPPAAAPPPSEPIKPGRRWYWIGGLLIAAGIATAVTLLIVWAVRTSDTVDKFARVRVVPDEGATTGLDFKKSGTYTIYYEWRSEVDGERIDNDDHDPPSQLDVEITGPDGQRIATEPEDRDITFSFNDKVGRAVEKVRIPAPGPYVMRVTSSATQPFAIAVGKGVIRTIIPYALIGIGALLLGLGLGLTAIIVTAVKRGRRKRERRELEQASWGGYGPPQPAPAYPGAAPPPPAGAPPWDAPAPAPPPTSPLPAPPPPAPAPPPPAPNDKPPWGPPGR
jgi:hypothetical protein